MTLLVLLTSLVLGCKDLGESIPGTGDWAIYRLSDPSLTTYEIRDQPLSSLVLASVPFISVGDIRSYDWHTHAIEFTPEMNAVLDTLAHHGGSTQGRPFVVTVGAERIYLGTFWWAYSSMMPQWPYIETISPDPKRIELPRLHQGIDPRADVRIYWSLKREGVLRE